MTCKTTGISCCYSTWSAIRIEIIKVTIKYLQSKIIEVQNEIEINKDDEEVEYINGFAIFEYDRYIEDLNKELINPIQQIMNNNNYKVDDIFSTFQIFRIMQSLDRKKETLVCFNVFGLYSLCNQGDCGGAYSIGESYDIVELLRVIKPHFDNKSDMYLKIYNMTNTNGSSIYDIFYDSVSTFTPIRIT